MNDELKRDLGTTGATFAETTKQMISTGQHSYSEFWPNAETELLCQFQDVLVKHKESHSVEELIFFSLVVGQATQQTIDDLREFEKESEGNP